MNINWLKIIPMLISINYNKENCGKIKNSMKKNKNVNKEKRITK